MPVMHSVLALYGAVSDALFTLHDPSAPVRVDTETRTRLRKQAQSITGLSGSAGEIGWYNELFRYFNDHSTAPAGEFDPLVPPALHDAVGEFQRIVDGRIASYDDGLPPSWASRAIEAAFVLDNIRAVLPSPEDDVPPALPVVLAATPTNPGFVDGGILGDTAAAQIATALRDAGINTIDGLHQALSTFSELHPAVSTPTINPRMRKVKNEYCAVISTSAQWPDLTLAKLRSGINPVNWNKYFSEFFCAMTPEKPNAHGACDRYRLRTPLKFWCDERPNGLFINYDLDTDSTWPEADPLVLVDNGYIWITHLDPADPGQGVRVDTSKQLLISGMSSTALAVLARTMGWATNATDMFLKLKNYDTKSLVGFQPSPTPSVTPPQDTSTTWPVVIPHLPADIRDEMCADTNELLKKGLDDANTWFGEYMAAWHDEGIDATDFHTLTDRLGCMLSRFTKDVFTTATGNFRPKPIPDPLP
jgi:hypothetical protein